MNIYIKSVHFKTDKGLEEYINKKMQKIGKLHEGIIRSDVTLKLENVEIPENKTAEIKLKIKGANLIASKQCKTFEEATTLAIEAIQKQLDKAKDKPINRKGKTKLELDDTNISEK